MSQESLTGVLSGIRVLDMTMFLSGPFGTQILGDLGAEVIKIETGDGDQTRVLPPNFIAGESAYFLSANRNKKSVVIDYRRPEGVALIEKLICKCDVLMENHRPGGLAKYGITWDRAHQLNPNLVWCAISGFGQTGPYRERPAYDMVVQALSGGMSLTGEEGGKPVRAGIPIADLSGGLYGVIGALAALVGRQGGRPGRYIDISMLDCQIAMLSYQAAYYLHSDKVPGMQGRRHESIPSYRAFTAGDDRDFVICANTDRMWRSLCDVVERPDLRDDPRFNGRKTRNSFREDIWTELEQEIKKKSASEWVKLLHAAEIPVGTVNTLDHALADPQVQHRGMVMELQSTQGVRTRVSGNPIKISGVGKEPLRYPPSVGGDTHQVLSDVLGLQTVEIEVLAKEKIIAFQNSSKDHE